MINVLLVCEGPGDQDRKEFVDGEYIDCDGVMQNLIRKASNTKDITFISKQRQDIRKCVLLGGKYGKYPAKSRKLAQLAKKANCTHIAYHQDEDKKGLEKIYLQVEEYFLATRDRGMSCLAIVPQHMTENWLLSDEGAFEKLFSKKPVNPALPSNPEQLWGNKYTGNHPKQYIKKVLQQYHISVSSDVFAEIAAHSNIEVLRRKCPESFDKKFYMKIRDFISEKAEGQTTKL
jgi:hypothetical protein